MRRTGIEPSPSSSRSERPSIFSTNQGRAEVARADLVKGDNVRVVQGQDGFGFAFEPRQTFRVGDDAEGQDLDGDLASETRILRAVHLAHPPRAKDGHDFVRSQPRAGGQGHHGVASFCTDAITPRPGPVL